MVRSARAKRKSVSLLLLIPCLLTCMFFAADSAFAFSNITHIQINQTSTESVAFALYNTVNSSGSVVWSLPANSGMLIDTGYNGPPNKTPAVPALGTPFSLTGNPQTYSASGLGNINDTRSASSPLTTSNYGTASVGVAASTNVVPGNTVNSPNQHVGVAYNSLTSLYSSTTIAPSTAAVSYTALHADFTNQGSQISVPAGAVISATGSLSTGTQPSFAELALTGAITIKSGQTVISSTPFSVFNGYVWNGTSTASFGLGSGSNTLTGGNFTFTDNLSLGNVTIPAGDTISVDSYLTLVVDPGSSIRLGELTGDLPTIGVFAGSVVPEPSSWIQLGTSLVLLIALWGRRHYRRISLILPTPPGVSLVLLAGLTSLILGLGAPGTADAGTIKGTITIDGVSPQILASSVGYSSSSTSIDPVNQTVTFDGTYLSTGGSGSPAPGQSATYWVVFQDRNGTQTDATELMITGLTNPTSTENTSVHLFFERLITTPIDAGPGIYFIPQPAGFFDVAAYLVSQGAPNVPHDLSVLIASVPEPYSLVMGGTGLVAAVWLVQRHRRRGCFFSSGLVPAAG